jgi:O-antigen/teichoic acid export membrane protein
MRTGTGGGGRRDTTVLAAGSVLNGVLAYVFFALVTRALGAGPAAPVAVLWAWWSFAGAAFTFPVQHWITRTCHLPAGEQGVRRGLGRVAAAVVAASLVAGGLAWAFEERLFGPGAGWFPGLVVAVGLGSGVLGVVRGLLAGRDRFGALGLNLVLENGLRCVVAGGLVVADAEDAAAYGLALVAGYAVALLRPSALLPRTTGEGRAPGALGFVTGASAGQLLAQVTLTGGPVLLAAANGAPAEVTALFAGLALFRAPYTLALGMVSGLTGRLTRLVEDGRHATLTRLREGLVAATLVLAVAGGLGGAGLGPWLMELVFGDGVRLGGADTALVAVGSVFALANLVLTVGLLARGLPGLVARTWLLSLPVGAVALLVAPGDALTRTCWTFLVVEVAAWLGFLALERRADRR